jgi:teichoic acid transport system permease protein
MNLAAYAEQNGLGRVGARPPLGAYLRETWRRREFMWLLALYRVRADNQRNQLGLAWVVLRPIINAVVYGTVFGLIMGGAKPARFIEFLIVGVFFFEFFSRTFTSGAKSITSNRALVQSLRFPRIVLPMARVLEELVLFMPTLAVLLIFVTVKGNTPQWHWLLIIPLVLLYSMFNVGLTLITSRLSVHLSDLSEILPFISRLLFFSTGIFFDLADRFEGSELALRILDFQPLHELLTIARGLLLDGQYTVDDPWYWLYFAVWSVVLLVVGIVFFWQAEERYGRD